MQVHALDDPGPIYERMMDILCSITRLGLVHCDYNEFNVMLCPDRGLTVIDFPQMVSISHANAAALFDRDAACVTRFFQKKANYWVDDADAPVFEDLVAEVVGGDSIDRELRASGFDNGAQTALDAALHGRIGADDDASSESSTGESDDSDEDGESFASGDEGSDRRRRVRRRRCERADKCATAFGGAPDAHGRGDGGGCGGGSGGGAVKLGL